MERTSCIIIEDNILELLDEVDQQLTKNIVCCKCENPCDKTSRCALAMKNLLTDLHIFTDSYQKRNEIEPPDEVK